MKSNKFFYIFFILILLIISVNSVIATDTNDNSLNDKNIDDNLLSVDESCDINYNQSLSLQETEKLYSPNTVIVEPDPNVPNQVLRPTVQTAINNANPGDTLILKGDFIHCHFQITKPLTIKADSKYTTIGPCPHHTNPELSGYYGIFYISPEASGTVIEGFTFVNNNYNIAEVIHNPYAIYVDGASDIVIKDCDVNWNLNESFLYYGIIVKNSQNITVDNIYFNNSKYGIFIENSSDISILSSKFENGRTSAINILENSSDIKITDNEILNNRLCGINVSSANGIHIINNVIENNGIGDTGSGIYVNSNVTNSEIKGNLMLNNSKHAIMLDYRVRNMATNFGDENLLVISNNYFSGHSDMVVHRRTFEKSNGGEYSYNESDDTYYSDSNGDYIESKAIFYMKDAFVAYDIVCGFTYYDPTSPWGLGDYYLKSEVSQVKKGVYKLSIVDKDGNTAKYLSSFDVNFYLNNLLGIKKTVRMENGSAIADFTQDISSYQKTNNAVLVELPVVDLLKFNVSDSDIPQKNIVTKLTADKLTTYPLSDDYIVAKLTDSSGNALSSKTITFKINGKLYSVKSDKNGIAKVKVSLTSKKTYNVVIKYGGEEGFESSQTTAKITVKTGSSKSLISAKKFVIKKNSKKTYKFKLTSKNGKKIANQIVLFKLNGKIYNLKTSKSGIAKITIKLSKIKNYKVLIKYLGNSKFKSSSKTIKISVKR